LSKEIAHKQKFYLKGFLLVALVAALLAWTPARAEADNAGNYPDISQAELLAILRQSTTEQPVKVFYNDFDYNGEFEAFVIVGQDDYIQDQWGGGYSGSLWFVSKQGAICLPGYRNSYDQESPFGIDSCELFASDVFDSLNFRWLVKINYVVGIGTASHDDVYMVEGYEAKKVLSGFIIERGMATGEFSVIHSTYDGRTDGSGHSFKPYYVFWDEDAREFREYGAIEITREQLLLFAGAAEILNDILQGDINSEEQDEPIELVNILYRGNGLIHINCRQKFESSNFGTLYDPFFYELYYNSRKQSVALHDVDNDPNFPSGNRGHYAAALYPDIAVYPEFKLTEPPALTPPENTPSAERQSFFFPGVVILAAILALYFYRRKNL
jgi:hypothetical protein